MPFHESRYLLAVDDELTELYVRLFSGRPFRSLTSDNEMTRANPDNLSLTQYGTAATPLWRCFNKQTNPTGFTSLEAGVDINQKNVAINRNSKRSSLFNFTRPDEIDDLIFSEVVWQTVRGEKSVMPAPRRGAFVRLGKAETADDDDD